MDFVSSLQSLLVGNAYVIWNAPCEGLLLLLTYIYSVMIMWMEETLEEHCWIPVGVEHEYEHSEIYQKSESFHLSHWNELFGKGGLIRRCVTELVLMKAGVSYLL